MFDASAKSSTGVSLNDMLLVYQSSTANRCSTTLPFIPYRSGYWYQQDVSSRWVDKEQSWSTPLCMEIRFQCSSEKLSNDPSYVWSFSVFICGKHGCKAECHRLHRGIPAGSRSCIEVFLRCWLTGADDPKSALRLQRQLTSLFSRGGGNRITAILLCWKKSPKDSETLNAISEVNEYTKTLGIELNISTDDFRLTIAKF